MSTVIADHPREGISEHINVFAFRLGKIFVTNTDKTIYPPDGGPIEIKMPTIAKSYAEFQQMMRQRGIKYHLCHMLIPNPVRWFEQINGVTINTGMIGPLFSQVRLAMAHLPRYVIPGQPQHIIQRGNNRQAIFAAESDYQFFRDALVEAAERFGRDGIGLR